MAVIIVGQIGHEMGGGGALQLSLSIKWLHCFSSVGHLRARVTVNAAAGPQDPD